MNDGQEEVNTSLIINIQSFQIAEINLLLNLQAWMLAYTLDELAHGHALKFIMCEHFQMIQFRWIAKHLHNSQWK